MGKSFIVKQRKMFPHISGGWMELDGNLWFRRACEGEKSEVFSILKTMKLMERIIFWQNFYLSFVFAVAYIFLTPKQKVKLDMEVNRRRRTTR